MFFLFGFKDIAEDLFLIVEGIFRGIFYSVCSLIYSMIYYFYKIFDLLCNGQLLQSEDLVNLFSRVGLLLGVVMAFRVAISFIFSLVNPDAAFEENKGIPGVIKKVIIVIVMFGVSTYVFDLTRELQVLVVNQNVIPNLVLPYKINEPDDVDGTDYSFGSVLAANLFTSFYNVNTDRVKEELTGVESKCDAKYIANLQKSIAYYNDFSYGRNLCLRKVGKVEQDGSLDFIVEFNFIFCTGVGVMVLWFLINYCIQVGMRIIQLTVLQIISPMAFISYLSPKQDNAFTNWLKLYISTYVDVFIRIGIINFVCYLCALIMQGWNSGSGVFWTSVNNPEGFTRKLIGVFMILALFTFAKKAPDLIKTLFPSTAGTTLGFGTADTGKSLSGFGSAVVGGAIGGAMGAATHFRAQQNTGAGFWRSLAGGAGGLLTGSARTGYAGAKGGMKSLTGNLGKQRQANNKYNDLVMRDGNILTAASELLGDAFGESRAQKDSRLLAEYSRPSMVKDRVKQLAHETKLYRDAQDAHEALLHDKNATQEQIQDSQRKLDDLEKFIIDESAANRSFYAADDDKSRLAAKEIESEFKKHNITNASRKIPGMTEPVTTYDGLSGQEITAKEKTMEIVSRPGYERHKSSAEFVGNDLNKTQKKDN